MYGIDKRSTFSLLMCFTDMCVEMSVLPDILVADSDLDYDESQENMGNMLHCHL